jgi:hypothetical protein
MSTGKYSGFSDVAKQAMMQPQESMLEVKNKKNKLYIGIPKEVSFQENRIPLTPLSVALLVNNGHDVMLESNAGLAANFTDTRLQRTRRPNSLRHQICLRSRYHHQNSPAYHGGDRDDETRAAADIGPAVINFKG